MNISNKNNLGRRPSPYPSPACGRGKPRATLAAGEGYIVADLLAPSLTLVFCGTAPSRVSAREKAYYANPGNRFWQVLHEVGLTPRKYAPQEYPELLTLGIGLTDLCKTASGNDDELNSEHIDCASLRKKIRRYKPTLVAFTSKHGARLFFGRKVEFGLQEETLEGARFFVLCSTSGRARRFWRQELWRELAALTRAL